MKVVRDWSLIVTYSPVANSAFSSSTCKIYFSICWCWATITRLMNEWYEIKSAYTLWSFTRLSIFRSRYTNRLKRDWVRVKCLTTCAAWVSFLLIMKSSACITSCKSVGSGKFRSRISWSFLWIIRRSRVKTLLSKSQWKLYWSNQLMYYRPTSASTDRSLFPFSLNLQRKSTKRTQNCTWMRFSVTDPESLQTSFLCQSFCIQCSILMVATTFAWQRSRK